MIKYNKAIRDRIPEIIQNSGKNGKVIQLTDEEYLPELEKKLDEEVQEYFSSRSIEELVDLIEIIYRIIELRKIQKKEFEEIRLGKLQQRGGFKNNLFLIEVKPC